MIRYTTGDILAEDTEALINPINCVGVMGRGLALQFKKAFPENYLAYAEACKHHQIRPGHMFIVETRQLANPRYIINFPTKRHWRDNSRIEDIDAGLKDLAAVINNLGLRSIAVPALGSGLGGLEWSNDVHASNKHYKASKPSTSRSSSPVPHMKNSKQITDKIYLMRKRAVRSKKPNRSTQ